MNNKIAYIIFWIVLILIGWITADITGYIINDQPFWTTKTTIEMIREVIEKSH